MSRANLHCILFVAWLGLAAGGGRAAEADERPQPRLFCAEPEYSFGAAANTREIVHDFTLGNTGAAPLIIRQVKIPCGCMLVRLTDDHLEPGEEAVISARFPLKGLSGRQRKRIVLLSNDPGRPHLELLLVGEAVAEVDVRPSRLFWGNLQEDAAAEQLVKVRFHEGAKYHLAGAQVSSAWFAVESSGAGDAEAWVRVRTVPPLRRGAFEETLTILTDHPRFGKLGVPMSGRVVGALYVIPEELALAPSNQPLARSLMVYSSRQQGFKVLRVQAPDPGIEVRIRKSVFSGCRVELKNIIPGPALDGKSVVIFTDDPTLPELKVPLRLIRP